MNAPRQAIIAHHTYSTFPAFPENYAEHLRRNSRALESGWIVELLKPDLLVQSCGFQPVQPSDPKLIRQSEQWLCAGSFEPFLKARAKYDEFAARLQNESGFRRDWRSLRKVFPKETASRDIIHRTLIPERNWVRDGGAKFRTRAQRFQACFDLLCWKYCLWGVGRGRPLLLKPSVVVTPHGTQIFIPAYLSFDAKRDLNLNLITRLHRARGIARQGEKLSAGRKSNAQQRKVAFSANREAKAKGLRGNARYALICQRLGRLDHGDYRQIRRLLNLAKL
jgi:hypothetical protein